MTSRERRLGIASLAITAALIIWIGGYFVLAVLDPGPHCVRRQWVYERAPGDASPDLYSKCIRWSK